MLPAMSAFIGAKMAEPRQSEEEYLHKVWLRNTKLKWGTTLVTFQTPRLSELVQSSDALVALMQVKIGDISNVRPNRRDDMCNIFQTDDSVQLLNCILDLIISSRSLNHLW